MTTANQAVLTEDAILKMSEDDYMNDVQLEFFRDRLRQMERDIRNNAGETTEHLRETVIVPDPADRATIEEEHALELRTRDRERKLLKKIEQALAQIDSGDYVPRPRCRWKLSSAANFARNCTVTEHYPVAQRPTA